MKQRLSDSLRGIAKGVVKPVPQRDAMKASILPTDSKDVVCTDTPELYLLDGSGQGDAFERTRYRFGRRNVLIGHMLYIARTCLRRGAQWPGWVGSAWGTCEIQGS